MKYRTLSSFRRDLGKRPTEHLVKFRDAVYKHFLPAADAGAFAGQVPWPPRLRVHRLSDSHIYSMTWSFASPDGRATFHLEADGEGTPVLVWRRIGAPTARALGSPQAVASA